jgi:3-phenylpropionate/trans-cinnamate dioxygenase ferredoxin reductase component
LSGALPALSKAATTMRRVNHRILIVGGGLAAQRAAETLRARGHHGPVRIVCGEPERPYDRPPLSKELSATPFRPAGWYEDQGIELLLGRSAARLEVGGRRVWLSDGTELGYDSLIIATGSRARRLPGLAGRPNVHVLRSLADAVALRAALSAGVRLAIVGAGFLGQEVAATARACGAEVTLIEAAPVPLAHVLGSQLGGWFAGMHRAEGVEVALGAPVAQALPAVAGAPVRELVLADGRSVAADVALVAVGVVPETRWLAGSPLEGDGVPVDDGGRTAIPGVYAAGDVARVYGERCEHWEPAARLGAAAARSILGMPSVEAPPASFWSDQYGVRIHLVGEAAGADAVELDGDPDSRDFTAVLRLRGALIGALLVGRPRELPVWRRRLADARQPVPNRSAA